eukprot:609540-Hanusia_phi.AAC.2
MRRGPLPELSASRAWAQLVGGRGGREVVDPLSHWVVTGSSSSSSGRLRKRSRTLMGARRGEGSRTGHGRADRAAADLPRFYLQATDPSGDANREEQETETLRRRDTDVFIVANDACGVLVFHDVLDFVERCEDNTRRCVACCL